MNIQVYTSIIGTIDDPRKDIKIFSEYNKFVKPVMNAKVYKILPHKFLNCDVSIWLDGNIYLKIPPEELVEQWLEDYDMVVFRHPNRDCVFVEAMVARQVPKVNSDPDAVKSIDEQIKDYKLRNIPENMGLYETGVIVRRHNEQVKRFNEAWWAEICRYSQRDQLSFPIVLKEVPLKLKIIESDVRRNEFFTYKGHI